jgi:DNA-binding CsgD family transcriptional regulator
MLERESYLAHLEEHRRQAAAGHGRLVLVGGEAGVGKTTLVDAFCRHHLTADISALRMSCDSLSTPSPLGPALDLAPKLGLLLDHPPTDSEERDRLFRAILEAFAARSDLTVAIGEDAHWAGGVSLEFLRFLARRIGDLRVLFIVTFRDDEVGPTHPLRRLLGDLATAQTVHRLGLPPLSEEAVRQMTAGSDRDPAALHRLTGGNPFFLTEVLTAEGASAPATVVDAILARAGRLSPEARAALDVAAVIGSAIDLDLLLAVAGPVLDEVDAGIAAGLLRAADDGLAFRHELAREAILAAITPPRRRLLHARVLAALREAPTEAHDLALLAHHAEAAGDREATLEFAVAAAAQATALHAHPHTADQYARALRVADRLPAAERASLHEARSVACYLSARGEEAIAARREAIHLWSGLGDPLREGDSLRWLSRIHWFEGHGAEAEAAAVAALDRLEPLPPGPELAMAHSNLSQLRMLADDRDGALLWGEKAIALADALGETETLLHALANVGTARLDVGDERGDAELRRSLRLALDHGFPDHAGRALTNLAWEPVKTWRLDEAERRIATALAYATEHDLDNYRWYLVATRAAVSARRGAWDEAEAEIRPLLRQPGLSSLVRIVALTAVGQIAARRGTPEAAELLDEALDLADRTGQLLRVGPVRAARAEAALLADDPDRARAEVDAIRDLAFARGNSWLRGEFAWLLRQAGEHDVPTADLAPPFALQIVGDVTGAAAVWQEMGCPYEEASALAASDDPTLMRQALAAFETLGAAPALGQVIRRLRDLGVRDLPPMRRGPRESTRANPAGLTQREAEVLALLVEGLRNAEIAERLYLTPKTVSHHISTIYAKLGVSSRTEAARAAAQFGVVPV